MRAFINDLLEGAKLHTYRYTGHVRLIVNEDNQVIIGTTFVGSQVGDLLYSAKVGKVSIASLWHAMPIFPIVTEIWIDLL
jgi:pyruvate/2-oxoglutarate dehydrogenase complex dihydrolipoamide dehydrogenase (E3) component